MKTISSFGGPFIALDRRFASEWGGVFGKRFVGDASPFQTDYEAACEATGGRMSPPRNCALIENGRCKGFLIAPPVETAIVESDVDSLLIVQVEAAEGEWSLADVSRADFDRALFPKDRDLDFETTGGRFVLFDSSSEFTDHKLEYLEFDLSEGQYLISNCEYAQGLAAELNLFRIQSSK